MQFRTQKGRFLVLDEHSNNPKETDVDLTESGNQNFYMMYAFRLNIFGLKLNIEGLKLNLGYFYDEYGTNVKLDLRQPPAEISTKGLMMGIFPIWLIDFFIPSNIEDMTREFFQTLVAGNNGEGVSMYFGSIPQDSLKDSLWLLTDAEVLSNGTMQFAHNLQRKMVREEDKLLKDIKLFEQQLWKTFYSDFQRVKSLEFCGEK